MKHSPAELSDRLSFRQAKTWIVLGLSLVFFVIGGLFILAPRWGATFFGIPAPEKRGLAYVQAIGFRDLALALYIIALTLFSTRRALSIVLGLTVLIPVCDVSLVATVAGLSAWGLYRPGFSGHKILLCGRPDWGACG